MRFLALASLLAPIIAGAPALAADPPLDYSYSVPAAVRAIPKLRAELDAEAAKARAAMLRDALKDRVEAPKDGRTFHGYSLGIEWSVVANTSRHLSLLRSYDDYTGGAHGSHAASALVWDKAAGVSRTPLSFFTSAAALDRALSPQLCDGLNRERVKRGVDVPSGAKDGGWPRCPSVKAGAVLLGSASGTRFDRIGVIWDQYVAGSYAEGPYEVTVPVTPAVLAAVRPADRTAFAVAR